MRSVKLDLDDLQRRAQAGVASGGQACFHDSATALALIARVRVRELEALVDSRPEAPLLESPRHVSKTIAERIAILEGVLVPTGCVNGTLFGRCLLHEGGEGWVLSLGVMGTPKLHYYGETIEKCLGAAEAVLL
jgi:hypothetical protein